MLCLEVPEKIVVILDFDNFLKMSAVLDLAISVIFLILGHV